MLFYFNYWVHDRLSSEQLQALRSEALHSKKLIENRVSQLQNEIDFIASLEVFNDIVTDDLDARILRLLEKKANIGEYEKLTLYALDTNYRVVASSQRGSLETRLRLQKGEHFIDDAKLYFVKEIHSSLNDAVIGYFVAEYALSNITTFIAHSMAKSYALASQKQPLPDADVTIKLDGLLSEYALYYKLKHTLNQTLFTQTLLFALLLLLFGTVGIYLLSKKLSKKFVEPIVDLTTLSTQIVEQQNFDIEIKNRDYAEIGALANIFNLLTMLQREKSRLLAKVEAASEAKSAFISSMSHELRTPLNAIIGYAQYLINYENLNDEEKQSVEKIEKAALHLLSLINEILDIAKIEAGKMEVIEGEIELKRLLEDCIALVAPLAKEKQLSLTLTAEELTLRSDEKRLKQIIINLLSNAIKFTNEGSVTLALEIQKQHCIIHVTDSGIGISEENLEKIFDEFVQLRDKHSRASKGSGLGLALSRHIAHTLGMELLIESQGEGKGTHAQIIIPL